MPETPLLRRAATVLAVPLLFLLLAACGDDDSADVGAPDTEEGQDLAGEVVVLAAPSLTEPFEDIASAFEAEHDGVDVRLTSDESSALAAQIQEGVPADVFAPDDEADLASIVDADLSHRRARPVPRGTSSGTSSRSRSATRRTRQRQQRSSRSSRAPTPSRSSRSTGSTRRPRADATEPPEGRLRRMSTGLGRRALWWAGQTCCSR